MTGHMPQASVATILAATTAEGQCALYDTHRSIYMRTATYLSQQAS